MQCTPFRILLLVVGLFSVVFQLVGICVPAWYRMAMTIDLDDEEGGSSMNMKIDIGLWMVTACYDKGFGSNEMCLSMTMTNVQKQVTDTPVNMDGIIVLQVMLILADVFCCFGYCCMCLYLRQMNPDTKCKGIGGAMFWGIGGIIGTAAVAIHVHQFMNMTRGIELLHAMNMLPFYIDVFFPWAVYFTGIGAFLAFVTGLVLAFRLCKSSQEQYNGYTAQYKA